MNEPFYRAQYFGGPCDGLVVVATRLEGDATSTFPVSAGGQDRGGAYRAVYRLRRICHLVEHRTPIVRYEYDYLGTEAVGPIASQVRSSWLRLVKQALLDKIQSKLWLSQPEGRPQRPGQAVRLPSCPGRGSARIDNQKMATTPTDNCGRDARVIATCLASSASS
jgi:hypothetical protein